jgi:hypothetical protein
VRHWLHWHVLLVCWALRYVYAGVALFQLWLALPFVSGYNWTASLKRIVFAVTLYAAGCFINSEWSRLSKSFMDTYHPGETWDE